MSRCKTRPNLLHCMFFTVMLIASAWAHAENSHSCGQQPGRFSDQDQASGISLEKSTIFKPLGQPATSALRDDFYSKATGESAVQVKSRWSQLSLAAQ